MSAGRPDAFSADRLRRLFDTYRDGLLHDTLPFWIPRAIDREHGGYLTALDRNGARLQTDKSVWVQGRFAWLLATLYATVERRPDWLELSQHGIEFLNRHCFDADGRMFFSVTQDGRPLRKRRYLFSEAFGVIGLAAYGAASGDGRCVAQARDLFRLMLDYHREPGRLEPKLNPATRRMKGLAMPMILMATAQELRKATGDALCDEVIDESIREIERDFLKPDLRCLLESVGPAGEVYDTFEGRTVCPGHAIEAGWFILEEARQRGLRDAVRQADELRSRADASEPAGTEQGSRGPRERRREDVWRDAVPRHLIDLGTRIIDWSLDLGWDEEHGGLVYFCDARGLPSAEYPHDMKLWWPHNEAIIAALLAWHLTRDGRYADWHARVHDWAYAHFPDPQYGEWFGYLHRDGTVSTRLKGNLWKGPFHLPRMQWYCSRLIEDMEP